MSQEANIPQSRSFKESVRMLHKFLLESRENGDIDIKDIGNFAQREGLKFGNRTDGNILESYNDHLHFLEGRGAIEFVDGEDTKYVRVVEYQE